METRLKNQMQGDARKRRATGRDLFALTIMAGLISSAYGQSEPAAQAQDASAASPASGNATPAPVSVVVRGIRSSLAMSAMEKQENVGLSDSVFSEDLGKFPDPNIADALARVPGVTVTRSTLDGEGTNVSIRGMGASFTRVILNGAPMASASGGGYGSTPSANREVDMDFLPSELFRRATVYKSSTANMIEGGISGVVDMRSVRPFDKSGFRSAFTLSGNFRDTDRKLGNTGSGVVSNTWNTRWGKVGLLGGVAFGNTKFATDAFQTVDMRNFQLTARQVGPGETPNATSGGSMSTPTTVPAGLPLNLLPGYARAVLVPGKAIDRDMLLALNPGATIQQIDNGLMGRLGRHMLNSGTRHRKGEVLSFQWQPNDDLMIYVDTLFAQKGSDVVQEEMNAGTRPATSIPIGLEFDRKDCTAGCTITKGIFANTFWGLEYHPIKENTHFQSFNPGFEFRPTDKLTVDGHVNFTRSSFYRTTPGVLVATQAAPSVINYDNTTSDQPPTYTGNIDVNDPNAGWGWYQNASSTSGLRLNQYERNNKTRGTRLNVAWGDNDFSIKVGGSYDDIERRSLSFDAQPSNQWQNIACANNMNYNFLQPNTTIQGVCDGRVAPGPVPATTYPGFGTGSSAGAPPLVYQGSAVPNSAVGSYLSATDHGFVTLDWPRFAQDTNYQSVRNDIYSRIQTSTGGYLRETVGAAYVQTDGRVELFGRTLRYNAGVRVARTRQTIGANTIGTDPRNANLKNGGLYPDSIVWAYETKFYNNVLPSGALVYNLRKDLLLRVAASKSITRANPNDLKQTRIDTSDVSLASARVTNPNLKPFRATNLDVGLEWYYTKEAYIAGAVFAKDLFDRPQTMNNVMTLTQFQQKYNTTVALTTQQQLVVNNDGGADRHVILVSEPTNLADKLSVRGLELTWQQPLDMLPVKGFGFTGNVTFVRQKDYAPNALPVVGVPERTNNLTLYYEGRDFNVRMSRQYQSSMITQTSTGIIPPASTGATAFAYQSGRMSVDLSVGVNLKSLLNLRNNLDLTLSAWNLNNAVTQSYVQFANAIYDQYKPGRSYTLSARTSF
jgi:TonB-dependent receptor